MKVVVEKAALAAAAAQARKAIDGKSPIPVLACVLLRASGETLTLHATNMDIALERHIAADVAQEGACAVAADKLLAVAQGAPDGSQIELERRDGTVMARAGRSRWRLGALDEADFPQFPPLGDDASVRRFVWDGKALAAAIERVKAPCGRDKTRAMLDGIFFDAYRDEAGADRLALVASDGVRLHVSRTAFDWRAPGIIVPANGGDSAAALIAALVKERDEIAVAADDRRLEIAVGPASMPDMRLSTKLIDATWFDWPRVVPAAGDMTRRVEVARGDLLAAAKALQPFGGGMEEKHSGVILRLAHGGLSMLAGASGQSEAGAAELDAQVAGDDLEVGLRLANLVETLDSLPGAAVAIRIRDAGAAMLFEDPGLPGETRVVMPARYAAPKI